MAMFTFNFGFLTNKHRRHICELYKPRDDSLATLLIFNDFRHRGTIGVCVCVKPNTVDIYAIYTYLETTVWRREGRLWSVLGLLSSLEDNTSTLLRVQRLCIHYIEIFVRTPIVNLCLTFIGM